MFFSFIVIQTANNNNNNNNPVCILLQLASFCLLKLRFLRWWQVPCGAVICPCSLLYSISPREPCESFLPSTVAGHLGCSRLQSMSLSVSPSARVWRVLARFLTANFLGHRMCGSSALRDEPTLFSETYRSSSFLCCQMYQVLWSFLWSVKFSLSCMCCKYSYMVKKENAKLLTLVLSAGVWQTENSGTHDCLRERSHTEQVLLQEREICLSFDLSGWRRMVHNWGNYTNSVNHPKVNNYLAFAR